MLRHLALTSFCPFFFPSSVAQSLTVCAAFDLAFLTQRRRCCPPPASWHRLEELAHVSRLNKLLISRDRHDVGGAVSAAPVKEQCHAFARFVSVGSFNFHFKCTCLFVRAKNIWFFSPSYLLLWCRCNSRNKRLHNPLWSFRAVMTCRTLRF